MTDIDRYESSLSTRHGSAEMQAIWSARRKFTTWRALWLALAEAQQAVGLSITDEQIHELRAHVETLNLDTAAAYESQLRHDVMAHIHALGDQAPSARPIIHLGATSQFVVCNTELLQLRDALRLVAGKLATAVHELGRFAARFRDVPVLGFTHLQPAQPTTLGKRATLWAQDLAMALGEVEHRLDTLRFRGVKGATGTQAAFLDLFPGDPAAGEKVDRLDRMVAEKMGWDPAKRFAVTAQTYPRLVDGMVAAALSTAAAAAAKFATDVRLLAHRREVEEPAGSGQVGSSAMAYKRNPMRCERIGGLARFVVGMTQVPFVTASEQWLERSLDDSATRRLSLPEPFLATDGALDVLINVARGLTVYEIMADKNLREELPFLATEHLLNEAVRSGADRQTAHEAIRRHAQAASYRVKAEGGPNDLLDRLATEPTFHEVDLTATVEPWAFIGRAPEQVDAFLEEVVAPIRDRYRDRIGAGGEVGV